MWAISWPSNRIEPSVGSISRSSSRAVVDLPQPDSPTRPSVSPRMTSKLTPSTALTAPTWRWKKPARIGKCLKRPSTSMIFSPADGVAPCVSDAATLIRTSRSPPHRGRESPPKAASATRGSYGLLLFHHVVTRVLRLDALAQLAPELAADLGHEQARDLMTRVARHGFELGVDLLVRLAHVRAAGVERAPARQVDERRRPARDRHELLAARRVQARDRGQQAPRVGVLRRGEDGVRVGLLDDPAGVHDRD